MKNKPKEDNELNELLENNRDKKNALKKIIEELDKKDKTTKKSN